jgi:hypothetical protein
MAGALIAVSDLIPLRRNTFHCHPEGRASSVIAAISGDDFAGADPEPPKFSILSPHLPDELCRTNDALHFSTLITLPPA